MLLCFRGLSREGKAPEASASGFQFQASELAAHSLHSVARGRPKHPSLSGKAQCQQRFSLNWVVPIKSSTLPLRQSSACGAVLSALKSTPAPIVRHC